MTRDRSSMIVVGVDDSEASVAALVFAMTEAVRRNSAVEAVTAWYFDNPFRLENGAELAAQAEERAGRMQERALTRALERLEKAPPVSQVVVRGEFPAQVLLRAAQDAAFLVVGHTQHRPIVLDRLLGSTSRDCLRHATSPVVVVPWVAQRAGETPTDEEVVPVSAGAPVNR